MILNFDVRKYGKLQEAYKLLNKSFIAMDQVNSFVFKMVFIFLDWFILL